MITKERDPKAVSSDKKGFYTDGTYDYRKKFFVPAEYKKRTTFDGKVLAVVRSKKEAGVITVTVSAEGCTSITINIPVR